MDQETELEEKSPGQYHMLKLKRVYEAKEENDGIRILVDGLWPRGLSQEDAAISEWCRDLAPSAELRKWFSHKEERWPEFRQRYLAELESPEKMAKIKEIAPSAKEGNVTLLYAAKNREHNNARVLEELVNKIII